MTLTCNLPGDIGSLDLWRAVPSSPMCMPRAAGQIFLDAVNTAVAISKSIPTSVVLLTIPTSMLVGFLVHDIFSSKREAQSSSSWLDGWSDSYYHRYQTPANQWYQTPLTWSLPRVHTTHASNAADVATRSATRAGSQVGRQVPGTDIFTNGVRP